MDRPKKYLRPFLFNDYSAVSVKERNVGDPWEVFVINQGSKTFNNNTDRLDFKEISYMQKFYVFEEDGEYLRLCKLDNSDDSLVIESSDYGWIHKNNLLLSRRCFVTNERGWINRKVISMTSGSSEAADSIYSKIFFKQGPGLEYKDNDEYLSHSDIYFVYQKIRVRGSDEKYTNWYFLGKSERFSNINTGEVLSGWVSEDHVIEWNNNILISPNMDPVAIEERRGGRKIVFFKNLEDVSDFLKCGEIKNEIWEEDFELYESDSKKYANKWFPLIKNNKGIIEVAVSLEGGSIFSPDDTNIVSQKGYFVDFIEGKTHNLFDKSLFVSSDEWTVLDEIIRKMVNVHTKEDLYKILINYAIKIVGNQDENDCGYIRITDLFRELYGVAPENSVFKDMVINEIENISAKKLKKIIDGVEKKYQDLLHTVYDNEYEFSIKSHSINYYMINTELLP